MLSHVNLRSVRFRGFSLIELLVVVAILVILMGLGIPAWNTIRGANRLTADAQTLADTLTFARTHALSKGRSVDVGMINSTNAEGIFVMAGEREDGQFYPVTRMRKLEGARIVGFSPPSSGDVIFTHAAQSFTNVVRFNSRGEARVDVNTIPSKIIVQLSGNGGHPNDNQIDIVIHGLSGGIVVVRDGGAPSP